MVELNEEARAYLTDEIAVSALMAQYGSPTVAATTSAVDYGVPIVVAGLKRRAEDSAGIVNLLNLVRSLDTSQLGTEAMWSRTSHRTVMGPDLVEVLFRDERGRATHETVVRKLAERSRVSPDSAMGILGSCAWMMLAVLVNRYSRSLDRQTLLGVADHERRLLSEQGWDPWIRAVEWETSAVKANETISANSLPSAPVSPVASASDRSGRYPPPVSRGDRQEVPSRQGYTGEPSQPGTRSEESGYGYGGGGSGGYGPSDRGHGQGGDRVPMGGDYGEPRQGGRHRPMAYPQPMARHTRPRTKVAEPEPRRWPIAVAVVGLLVVAGAAWWVLSRDDGTEVDSAAENAETAAAEDTAATEQPDAASDAEAATDAEAPAGPANYTGMVFYEVPMKDIFDETGANGTAKISINSVTGEACVDVVTEGVTGPYSSHIHLGDFGEKGPVVVDWSPMSDGQEVCLPNSVVDIEDILAAPAEYYTEMHDSGGVFTVRGQMSEATNVVDERDPALIPDPNAEGGASFETDPDGGGAMVRFQDGALLVQGAVGDQMILDEMITSLESSGVPVINELRVESGAPLPSGKFVANEGLYFPVGGDQLEGDNSAVLDAMAAVLTANPEWKLTIIGHTDNTGDRVLNLELSRRRAQSVRQALVDRGVDTKVLKIAGFGPDQPAADNSTPDGRRRNRRIEFVIDPT